jgi:site-specific DNA-methyltransferase (cytosine-N4-specific)
MPKSAIPMGSEFGPNQVDLVRVLELARQYEGDDEAFTNALAVEYKRPTKTAKNTILSMRKYLLIDDSDQLTEVSHTLLALQSQPIKLYTAFARHMLLNLPGIEVVNAIDTLIKSGERPTQLSIAEMLHAQGIYVPPSSTHISKLCGWLRLAGVFSCDGNFECLEMERVTQIIGANQQETDLLAEMPEDQRAVLKALCNLPMETIPDIEPLQGNKIKEYAEELYGTSFDPKSFKGDVLEPLQTAGYITLVNPSKVTGKSYLVYRTEKFANEYLTALVDSLANTGLAVRQLLRKSLSEILQEMQVEDTGTKGKALEALAFYFMRLLGLEFKAWRKRGKKASGFEVDVIVEGTRLVFSRWQIQCKNTPEGKVSLEDIAKEVGLSIQLKSNVILVVTTGQFSRDALIYADDVMQDTHLNIVTLVAVY